MRARIVWTLLIAAVVALYVQQRRAGYAEHVYMGAPTAVKLSASTYSRVLVNPGFLIGYSDVWKQALWVAYTVQPPEPGRTPPRPDFVTDYRAIGPVHPGDFANTGYERGHLAPNYAMARIHGREAQVASFRMSNIAPQLRSFNRGVWQRLEEIEVDDWAAEFGRLYVIVGPVFSSNTAEIGSEVRVPTAFFRIVVDLDEQRPRAIAFLLPHDTPADASLGTYAVTIDEIEAQTGLNFFSELDDLTEASLETEPADARWNLQTLGNRPARYQ